MPGPHGVTRLGAISSGTTYQPPLPPCRVGNRPHPILGRFKVGLGWLVNTYSSHFIHRGEQFMPTKPKGISYGQKKGKYSRCKGTVLQ